MATAFWPHNFVGRNRHRTRHHESQGQHKAKQSTSSHTQLSKRGCFGGDTTLCKLLRNPYQANSTVSAKKPGYRAGSGQPIIFSAWGHESAVRYHDSQHQARPLASGEAAAKDPPGLQSSNRCDNDGSVIPITVACAWHTKSRRWGPPSSCVELQSEAIDFRDSP